MVSHSLELGWRILWMVFFSYGLCMAAEVQKTVSLVWILLTGRIISLHNSVKYGDPSSWAILTKYYKNTKIYFVYVTSLTRKTSIKYRLRLLIIKTGAVRPGKACSIPRVTGRRTRPRSCCKMLPIDGALCTTGIL